MTISGTLALLRYETPRGAARNGGFVEADGRSTNTAPDRAAFNSGHVVKPGDDVAATLMTESSGT